MWLTGKFLLLTAVHRNRCERGLQRKYKVPIAVVLLIDQCNIRIYSILKTIIKIMGGCADTATAVYISGKGEKRFFCFYKKSIPFQENYLLYFLGIWYRVIQKFYYKLFLRISIICGR